MTEALDFGNQYLPLKHRVRDAASLEDEGTRRKTWVRILRSDLGIRSLTMTVGSLFFGKPNPHSHLGLRMTKMGAVSGSVALY